MNISVEKNVIYDEVYNLVLDIYKPENKNGYGIIDIHGGGWFQGDKTKDEDLSRKLAYEGYTIITPNYRSASDYPFPAARDDIIDVYDWAIDSKIVNKKIGVIGSSSGGNLAIELSLAKGIPAVSWSGIIDIDNWLNNHIDVQPVKDTTQNAEKLSSDRVDQGGPNDSYYKWFVLNYINDDPKKAKEASLVYRVNESAGPMFLVNSINELAPAEGIIMLSKELSSFGVPVMTKLIPGGKHGKGYMKEAWKYTLDFFHEYLK